MENKFIVSLSPHVHSGDSVQKNMYGVLIALIPAFLVSLYFFGLGALIVTATSVAACLFFEWAIGKFLMKKETTTITDGSAIITGVLLAFNLPSNLPIWIIILGALFAIGVGKMSFGGLGCNPFNPALAGRVFLLLSFPVQMTTWPAVGQLTAYTDATTAATPLAIMKGVINGAPGMSLSDLPGAFDLLIGNNGGGECLGAAAWFVLHVVEENHHLAHSGIYSGDGIRVLRYHVSGQSGTLCIPGRTVVVRWSDAGCCLYGYGLRDFSDEPQRYADLWCLHRPTDCHHPSVRCISGGYVVCHSDYECVHSAHQHLC